MSSLTNQQAASPFNPALFRDAYSAIQKAGDQGLSMEELSQVVNMQGVQCIFFVGMFVSVSCVSMLSTLGKILFLS